jgi:hypothetical protein
MGGELDSLDSILVDPFCTGDVAIYGMYKEGVSALNQEQNVSEKTEPSEIVSARNINITL